METPVTTVPTSTTAPSTSVPTNTTPSMSTAVNSTVSSLPADIDAETLAMLADLDRASTREERNLIPEIKLIQTDKQVIDFSALINKPVQKGQFIAISYDPDGNKIYEDFGTSFSAIIVKNTNAYNLYDEVEQKSTYYSSEFEGKIIPVTALRRAEDKKIIFQGSQHDLKQYLLAHFPSKPTADGKATHQFSFRNIIYVIIPSMVAERGPLSVYRLLLSHTSLDGMRDFYDSISGTPIKYIAKLSSKAKMTANNVSFVLQVGIEGDAGMVHSLVGLPNVVQMKAQLDQMVAEMQNHFMTQGTQNTPLPSAQHTPALPTLPVSMGPVGWPMANANTMPAPQPTGLASAADDVFAWM